MQWCTYTCKKAITVVGQGADAVVIAAYKNN